MEFENILIPELKRFFDHVIHAEPTIIFVYLWKISW